uniref:Uncharacterized protein n=1 Tax=Eutreptiella gymnastica TaxID=73025 RepID=A0A6U7SXB2_9EUGL
MKQAKGSFLSIWNKSSSGVFFTFNNDNSEPQGTFLLVAPSNSREKERSRGRWDAVDVVDITLEGWLACRKMSTTSIQSRACTQAQTQTHTHTHTHRFSALLWF